MRINLRWFPRILVGFTLSLVMIVGGLSTSAGQRILISAVEWAAASDGTRIEIGRLEGSLFSTGQIDRIAVSDSGGVWLEARDAQFSWNPLALASGRLEIQRLLVGTIELRRYPLPSPTNDRAAATLDIPMVAIDAERWEISQLKLGAPLLGTPAELRLAGSVNVVDEDRGLSVTLNANRMDGSGGAFSAKASYQPNGKALELSIAGSEPAGGLFANYLELPGSPPMTVEVDGRGPLDQWRAQWSVAASGEPFIAGQARIDANDRRHDGLLLRSRLDGYLAPILPPALKAIFDGKTVAVLEAVWDGSSAFEDVALSVKSDTLDLSASGGFNTSNFYLHGGGRFRLGEGNTKTVLVPLPDGGTISFAQLEGAVELPDRKESRKIAAEVSALKLDTPWGYSARAELTSSARQTQPVGEHSLSLDQGLISLAVREFVPREEKFRGVLGPSADFEIRGRSSSGMAVIESFAANAGALRLAGHGKVADGIATVTADVIAEDLGKFSSLADVALAGESRVKIQASLPLDGAPIEIALDGRTADLGFGGRTDGFVLPGDTHLAAAANWNGPDDWTLKTASLSNSKLSFRADGRSQSGKVVAAIHGKLPDLSLASPSLSGALQLNGKLEGAGGDFQSTVSVSGDAMSWKDKAVSGLKMSFNGTGPASNHRGSLKLNGSIDGKSLNGSSLISFEDSGAYSIEQLKLVFESAKLSGGVYISEVTPITGQLELEAPDLKVFETFTRGDIGGSLSLRVQLGGTKERPLLRLETSSENSTFGGIALGRLEATADLADYLSSVVGQAKVRLDKLDSDVVQIENLRADFHDAKGGLRFDLAAIVNGADALMRGDLIQRGSSLSIGFADVNVSKSSSSVRLEAPSKVSFENGTVAFQKFGLVSDGGRAVVSGFAGRRGLSLKLGLTRLPAALANVFRDKLGLRGTIDGSITAKGSLLKPVVAVSLDWHNASAAALQEASLPPVFISLKAELQDEKFENDLAVRGADGLNVRIAGGGTLSSAQMLSQRVTGEVPLSLANSALATRGTRLSGKAALVSVVSGSTAAPEVSGTVTLSGVTVADPASGLRLNNVNGVAQLKGDSILIEELRGLSDKGGSASLTGSITNLLGRQPRTQLSMQLAGVKFNDKKLISGVVDGDLSVTGPLADLNAVGSIYVKRLDMTVPNQLPRSVAALSIRHVNAPLHLKSAASKANGPVDGRNVAVAGGVTLSIAIDAADRIFVRGRGLEAQLGGNLKIGGTSAKPEAFGAFDLVRGRLSILGKKLEFKRGKISFAGNLDPYVELEASALVDDVTVSVKVSGPASRLAFQFSSIPDLPEDEVVAKLLFNKTLAKLSPLQLAQLADEVNKLGGFSSGPSILDQLKTSVGIDVLDIGTDKSGGPTVSAGSYLNDKTYVGVKQGTGASSSRVVIDHELTKTLKARGEVGADGNSKIGLGVEWDY